MAASSITLHLPYHRERTLSLQTEAHAAALAYDANISDYVRFLQSEAQKSGLELVADHGTQQSVYSINAPSREEKMAAHGWLERQPDLWNWIP